MLLSKHYVVVKSNGLKLVGNVEFTGEQLNRYQFSAGSWAEKWSLAILTLRCHDNITMDLKRLGGENMDQIYFAKNSRHWWAIGNTAWSFGIYKKRSIYWAAEQLLASQEVPFFMEFITKVRLLHSLLEEKLVHDRVATVSSPVPVFDMVGF